MDNKIIMNWITTWIIIIALLSMKLSYKTLWYQWLDGIFESGLIFVANLSLITKME